MVQEWNDRSALNADGLRLNLERWQIWNWEKVFWWCAGEDGDLIFDSESVKVMRAEKRCFVQETAYMQEWIQDDRIPRSVAK